MNISLKQGAHPTTITCGEGEYILTIEEEGQVTKPIRIAIKVMKKAPSHVTLYTPGREVKEWFEPEPHTHVKKYFEDNPDS